MERFRRPSQSTTPSPTVQLLESTHEADEVTRNFLQLLFDHNRDFILHRDSPDLNLITCLKSGDFHLIDFNTLNRAENFSQTTYPQPISKGRKTAVLLARCIFYYFIYHGKNIKDLYQFICHMITSEKTKEKDAFRQTNIASSLITFSLSYIHTYSMMYEPAYLLTTSDIFAKFIFHRFLNSFKTGESPSNNSNDREIKNFNFFYKTFVLNMEKGSPSYYFFLNREEYFRVESQKLLQSLSPEAADEASLLDQIDISLEVWGQLREKQVKQDPFKSLAPSSNLTTDEDKSSDTPLLSVSIDEAWGKLQTKRQLILDKLESQIEATSSPTKRRSFLSRRSVGSNQPSSIALIHLRTALHDSNLGSASALQVLKKIRSDVPGLHSSTSEEFEFSALNIEHLSILIRFIDRVYLIDMASEQEPQKNCLKLLFDTEFYVNDQSLFECLKQRDFLCEIDFGALNFRTRSTGLETNKLFSKIILQYLQHHQFELDEIKQFIEKLIECAAKKTHPFQQPDLIDHLTCICLIYVQKFCLTSKKQISFITYVLIKIVEIFYKDQVYISEQAFHSVYERFVAPSLSNPSDAYKNLLLRCVNASLNHDTVPIASSEQPLQTNQLVALSPSDLDLHTRFNAPTWCSSPKSTSPSRSSEQKVSTISERTASPSISIAIQKAWETLVNQKKTMLTEVTRLISIVTNEIGNTSSLWQDKPDTNLIDKRHALEELEALLKKPENYTLTAVEILKTFRCTAPDLFIHIEPPESDYIQLLLTAITQKRTTSPKKATHQRSRTFSSFFGIGKRTPPTSSHSKETLAPPPLEFDLSSVPRQTRPRSVSQFHRPDPNSPTKNTNK